MQHHMVKPAYLLPEFFQKLPGTLFYMSKVSRLAGESARVGRKLLPCPPPKVRRVRAKAARRLKFCLPGIFFTAQDHCRRSCPGRVLQGVPPPALSHIGADRQPRLDQPRLD